MSSTQVRQDAEIYREAAELTAQDQLLRGSTLIFPDYGQLVATGDIHGHRRNIERVMKYCDLEHAPTRHVLLQEIIHEEPQGLNGLDMSHEALLEVARWKVEYPDQIHFLQSNHELAQLIEQDISKGGRIVTFSFLAGMRESYGDGYLEVAEAMMAFIRSYALAARTANRIMLTHSLPSPGVMSEFDPTVIDREPTDLDLQDGGSGYLLVWGRHQTPGQLEHLREAWGVDFFICGHQPQESGYAVVHDRMVILASDHNHGTILPFDLKRDYDIASLERSIRPLASIG